MLSRSSAGRSQRLDRGSARSRTRRRSRGSCSSFGCVAAARVPRVLRIGVAREIKTDEYRVALTPAGARELVQKGHDVLIENGAGDGSAFPDEEYVRAGAQIGSVDDVTWENSFGLAGPTLIRARNVPSVACHSPSSSAGVTARNTRPGR